MKHARDSLSGVEFESPIGEIGSNNVHILRQDSLDLRKSLLGGHQGTQLPDRKLIAYSKINFAQQIKPE